MDFNRGAKQVPLKRVVDEALESCESVHSVIVYNCLNWAPNMRPGRDHCARCGGRHG